MNSEFFEKKLELYRNLDVKLVQYGGGAADWLVALGRTDLLKDLTRLIRKRGFIPLLVCHWASLVLPHAEKELDAAGYVIPLNRLWSLQSLSHVLKATKGIRKPIIAIKPLAQGALARNLEGAFRFLFKKAGVTAVLVGVSSVAEAKQTFQALGKMACERDFFLLKRCLVPIMHREFWPISWGKVLSSRPQERKKGKSAFSEQLLCLSWL